MDDDEQQTRSWEGPLDRSWLAVQENDGLIGNLELERQLWSKFSLQKQLQAVGSLAVSGPGKITSTPRVISRGAVRSVMVVVDVSTSQGRLDDYKPQRRQLLLEKLIEFTRQLFDHNPLSHLSIALCSTSLPGKCILWSPPSCWFLTQSRVVLTLFVLVQPIFQATSIESNSSWNFSTFGLLKYLRIKQTQNQYLHWNFSRNLRSRLTVLHRMGLGACQVLCTPRYLNHKR